MKAKTTFYRFAVAFSALACLAVLPNLGTAADSLKTEANRVAEISFDAAQPHSNPFIDVALEVVFTDPDGGRKTIPAFWAGGRQWKVRYASPVVGTHRYRTQCNDTGDAGLYAFEGRVEVRPYRGERTHFIATVSSKSRATIGTSNCEARACRSRSAPSGSIARKAGEDDPARTRFAVPLDGRRWLSS